MKARFAILIASGAVLGFVACSEYQPGKYEGGGRTGGPVIVGGVGTSCSAVGAECQSSDDCCSHNCTFTGQILTCAPPDDSGAPTCTPNNATCANDSDCCSAFCSAAKLCANTPVLDSGGGG
jgi:hypothetical protein